MTSLLGISESGLQKSLHKSQFTRQTGHWKINADQIYNRHRPLCPETMYNWAMYNYIHVIIHGRHVYVDKQIM